MRERERDEMRYRQRERDREREREREMFHKRTNERMSHTEHELAKLNQNKQDNAQIDKIKQN